MDLAAQAKKVVDKFGQPMQLMRADGTGKGTVTGVTVKKKTEGETGNASLESYSTQTLYIAATRFVPDVNDIVVISNVKKRIMSLDTLLDKGKVVLYVMEVM